MPSPISDATAVVFVCFPAFGAFRAQTYLSGGARAPTAAAQRAIAVEIHRKPSVNTASRCLWESPHRAGPSDHHGGTGRGGTNCGGSDLRIFLYDTRIFSPTVEVTPMTDAAEGKGIESEQLN